PVAGSGGPRGPRPGLSVWGVEPDPACPVLGEAVAGRADQLPGGRPPFVPARVQVERAQGLGDTRRGQPDAGAPVVAVGAGAADQAVDVRAAVVAVGVGAHRLFSFVVVVVLVRGRDSSRSNRDEIG